MVTGKWLTVQQAADVLQVRIETVRRWIRRGEIPVLEIGGPRVVYRIRQVDLDEFLRARYRPMSEQRGAPDEHSTVERESSSARVAEPGVTASLVASADIPQDLMDHMPAVTFRERQQNPGAPSFLGREIESILGYPVDDFVSHPGTWLDLVHPDDRERVEAEMARTDATGDPFRMEYRMIARDGGVVWVSVDAVLVDVDQEGPCWEGVIVDVTERRELEEALRQRQLQQQTIADLGRMALDGASLASLLQDACRLVCAAMGVTRAIVYEVLPGGTLMAMRAQHVSKSESAPPDVDAASDPDSDPDALSTYALTSREPVVSEQLSSDERFDGAAVVASLGAQSGASITIPGRVRPFGVLTVLSRDRRKMSREDLFYLHSVVNIIGSNVAQSDTHWLTVAEVAGLLQVTEDTVRRWIRNLELPALSLGGARAGYRVYPSDLERFIEHRLKRLDP